MEVILWGALLRVLQVVIQATPTILVGLLVAAVFRRLLGHEGTRRLFGCGTRRELPQAWLMGMLLPVCSLGVIPIIREMRRAGIAGGPILAFAMTAPLFNPLSMLYGLTLSAPSVILGLAFCTMIVVTVVGLIWERLCHPPFFQEPTLPPVRFGVRRMASLVVAAAREVTGPSIGYIACGLAGVAILSAVLPTGSLQSTMEHNNPYAPLAMAAVAIPAYATPMVAMSQLGSMFQHANSIGAAFVLLVLGAGINLGLIVWVHRAYGSRRTSVWMGLTLAIVLGLAYAIEDPLHPSEIEPPGHTHAFDIYCCPFPADSTRLPALVAAKLKEELQPAERVGLTVLTSLVVLGLVLRRLDRRWHVETWLEERFVDEGPRGRLDLIVPGPVLGALALIGIVILSIVGCYAYYPAPREVFEEMHILRGEVLTAAMSGNQNHVKHFVPIWDDWTRRLQVGALLRGLPARPYHRMKAKVFRDRLEFLKHAVEEGEREEIRELIRSVDQAYHRMRSAFLES